MLTKNKFIKLFCLTITFYTILIGCLFLATSISGLNYVSSKPFSSNLTIIISLITALLAPFLSIGIMYAIVDKQPIKIKQTYLLSIFMMAIPILLFLVVWINLSLQYKTIFFPGLLYAILGLLLFPSLIIFILNITVTAFISLILFRLFYRQKSTAPK